MRLDVLPTPLAVVRLAPDCALPEWASFDAPLTSVTRTADELSIVCAQGRVPPALDAERGWRALAVEGPLDFSLTGVLDALATPLAEAGIPIFAISTYETDYVLVREDDLANAVRALTEAGHQVGRK